MKFNQRVQLARIAVAGGLLAAHDSAVAASSNVLGKIIQVIMPSREALLRGTEWEGTPEPTFSYFGDR